jgi:hypothetical protein
LDLPVTWYKKLYSNPDVSIDVNGFVVAQRALHVKILVSSTKKKLKNT